MIIKKDFYFPPKNASRPLHIWLPEDYYDSTQFYPVMYFFDGHNLFLDADATYGKSWGMKDFMEQWGKRMIIVGMECGHEGQERLSEYLPYPAIGHFAQFEPMGAVTMEWILQDVKPYIDEHFRTIPFRECTAIGGSSMGGLMALYAVVHHNRWFSKAACVSSAIGCCMEPLMAQLQAAVISPDTRIYLSWGSREAYGAKAPHRGDKSSRTYFQNKEVADTLKKKKAPVLMHCQVGGSHCEADWEKQVPLFMDFLWMQ